jgi:hypothetical protein
VDQLGKVALECRTEEFVPFYRNPSDLLACEKKGVKHPSEGACANIKPKFRADVSLKLI